MFNFFIEPFQELEDVDTDSDVEVTEMDFYDMEIYYGN